MMTKDLFCDECGARLLGPDDIGFSGTRDELGCGRYPRPVRYWVCRDCADEREATAMRDMETDARLGLLV